MQEPSLVALGPFAAYAGVKSLAMVLTYSIALGATYAALDAWRSKTPKHAT